MKKSANAPMKKSAKAIPGVPSSCKSGKHKIRNMGECETAAKFSENVS
jgi:hypothetical protein